MFRLKLIVITLCFLITLLNINIAYANSDPIYVLPIIVNPEDASKLVNEFGTGSNRVKLGFSIGYEYLSNDFTYVNNDHHTNPTYINNFIIASKQNNLPFLVHLNGHRWTVADYIASNDEAMMYTDTGIPITKLPEWVDPNQPKMGPYPAYRVASYLFSLNEYNSYYRNYKKRNIQEAGRYLVDFANANPNLFAGVSLDSEISFCPAGFPGFSNYKYSFDYNIDTIVQWRHWLSGNTGSYINGNYPNPYKDGAKLTGKGKNLDIDSLKNKYGINYASWDYVSPPTITLEPSGYISIISGNQALVNDWLEFKASLTNNMLADMINWLVEVGIPRNKIYSHQQPLIAEYPELNKFCGVPYDSAQVNGAGYGSMLYGDMTNSLDLVTRISNLNSNWGLFEWNPANLSNPLNQTPNYVSASLQLAYDHGADIIAPNYYISTSPLFPADTLELNGNIAFFQGLKDFIINNKPAAAPSDLNFDGKVDYLDYDLLVSGFGSTYNIFDFNRMISTMKP